MTTLTGRTTTLVAVALLLPFMAAVWLMFKPTFISGSTYVIFAAVVITAAAIAIHSWQNGQATTSTTQVIHDAEVATPTAKTR